MAQEICKLMEQGKKKHGKGKITAYNENILRVQGEGMD
jgi:hypothetical protein